MNVSRPLTLLLLTLALGLGLFASPPSAAQKPKPDKVVARVNGEVIYASELEKGIPADAFDTMGEALREATLERLINAAQTRQFLRKRHITITDNAVKAEIARMEKVPPLMGCPCHRFANLAEYMTVNGMSRAELRENVRNTLGLKKYVASEWNRSYPTKMSRQKLVAATAQQMERTYIQAYQIYFSTFQPSNPKADSTMLEARARARSQEAWKRLQRGESFATVAKSFSEDTTSNAQGGDLGVIHRDIYGYAFRDALSKLRPGEVSRPFKGTFGYHIIKWTPIRESDLYTMAREDFDAIKEDEAYNEMQHSAKIERSFAMR